MPNHVTTRCTVSGPVSDIAAFRQRCIVTKADDRGQTYTLLDFGSVIPMPAILEGDESSFAEIGAALIILRAQRGAPFATGGMYKFEVDRVRADVGMPDDSINEVAAAYLAKHPDQEALGRQRLQAVLETGYASWYPWSIKHWGTKWNSYSFRHVADDPLQFIFETAWSFPLPVFEKLATEFPSLRFHCATFDEGWNFAGVGFFNPASGEPSFDLCAATDELHAQVYGHAPEREDEDESTA